MARVNLKGLLPLSDRTARGKALWGRGLQRLTDFVYPPRCLACPEPTETPMGLCGACWGEVIFLAGPVCDLCGTQVPSARGHGGRIICESCTQEPPGWDRGRAAVAYEAVGRRIVLGLKSRDRLDSVPTLARWMTGAAAQILTPDMIVVPIPMHWQRRLARRYNQAAELARAVARRAELAYGPHLLIRTRAAPPQHGQSRQQRRAAQQGTIAVPPKYQARVCGSHVLLVDDVMTTGATLGAATEALRAAGAAQVSVLVLARVETPS